MDGGTVYSNEPEVNADIRAFEGGLMKTLPLFRDKGLKVRHEKNAYETNIITRTYFHLQLMILMRAALGLVKMFSASARATQELMSRRC